MTDVLQRPQVVVRGLDNCCNVAFERQTPVNDDIPMERISSVAQQTVTVVSEQNMSKYSSRRFEIDLP